MPKPPSRSHSRVPERTPALQQRHSHAPSWFSTFMQVGRAFVPWLVAPKSSLSNPPQEGVRLQTWSDGLDCEDVLFSPTVKLEDAFSDARLRFLGRVPAVEFLAGFGSKLIAQLEQLLHPVGIRIGLIQEQQTRLPLPQGISV